MGEEESFGIEMREDLGEYFRDVEGIETLGGHLDAWDLCTDCWFAGAVSDQELLYLVFPCKDAGHESDEFE